MIESLYLRDNDIKNTINLLIMKETWRTHEN